MSRRSLEHQQARRIATSMEYENFDSNIHPLIKEKLLKRKEKANSVILHYTHEQRFSDAKRLIHQLWNDTFQNTPITETKLIVGTRNNPNRSKELIRKSPYPTKPNSQ